jgi:membrane protein implicated in regulation of membrane protease activity
VTWNPATVWWIAAGALVALELITGTFYLLMLALGAAAGAVAAHLGLGVSMQVLAAAVVGGGATAAWHVRRSRQPSALPSEENRDVNLDIGQSVQVSAWNADGTAHVQYRGATWQARLAQSGTAMPGRFTIVAVRGSELHLAPATPP